MADDLDNRTVEGDKRAPAVVQDDTSPPVPAAEKVQPQEVVAVEKVMEDAEAILEGGPDKPGKDKVLAVLEEMKSAIAEIKTRLDKGEVVRKDQLSEEQREALHAGKNTRARRFLTWLDSCWGS